MGTTLVPKNENWEAGLYHVVDLPQGNGSAWVELQNLFEDAHKAFIYGEATDRFLPWRRCLAIAKDNGATTAVIERRYIDRDYRSENSELYSRVLAPMPDTSQRIHFFRSSLDRQSIDAAIAEAPGELWSTWGYLGYISCRPAPLEIVGRAMLSPPEFVTARTAVTEDVNFFGLALKVKAVPFMQQDSRLAVCAHAAIWCIHYTASLRGLVKRKTVADIVAVGSEDIKLGAQGLTHREASLALARLGFRPQHIQINWDRRRNRKPPWRLGSGTEIGSVTNQLDSDLAEAEIARVRLYEVFRYERAIAESLQIEEAGLDEPSDEALEARDAADRAQADFNAAQEYEERLKVEVLERSLALNILPSLNSGVPVYVSATGHAFVLCGYQRRVDDSGVDSGVEYLVHDDRLGPYLRVYSPMGDYSNARRAQTPRSLDDPKLSDILRNAHRSVDAFREQEVGAGFPGLVPPRLAWANLVLPLMENVHLSFIEAEDYASARFDWFVRSLIDSGVNLELGDGVSLGDLEPPHNSLTMRTYTISSVKFKRSLEDRGFSTALSAEYRKMRLPANVHVVEFLSKERDSTANRLVGEVLLDSTSGSSAPWVHAVRVGPVVAAAWSNGNQMLSVLPVNGLCGTGSPGRR